MVTETIRTIVDNLMIEEFKNSERIKELERKCEKYFNLVDLDE